MDANVVSRTDWRVVGALTIGIAVFLTVICWTILISGLNRPLVALWIYVPLPVGILNVAIGIRSKKRRKGSGDPGNSAIAATNIVTGVLDVLLGITPWVVLIFFFRWISPREDPWRWIRLAEARSENHGLLLVRR